MRLVVAVLVLAACGDGVSAPDAVPPPDSTAGLVRVRYGGALLDQHPVFFQNADGSIVLATRTGVDGTANAYMGPGGYVTLVEIDGNSQKLYTWSQVQPGDELVIDHRRVQGVEPATTLTISIPIVPGAGFYDLETSCGSENVSSAAGTSLVINLGDCGVRADMFVIAFGAGFNYLYAEDVPTTNGGTVTLPPPYSVMERSTVAVTNAPAATSSMTVTQRLIGEGHSLFQPSPGGIGYTTVPIMDGTGTTNFDMPLPPAATVMTEVAPDDGLGLGHPYVARWERARPTTAVDFAAAALRRYASRPRYDAPTHSIVWTEEPAGSVATAVIASFGWFRPEIGGNYQWSIIAPRGADPAIHLPVLPDPQYLPRTHDTINEPYELTSIAVDYAQIRSQLLGNWSIPGAHVAWPAEGPSGEVVYQELTSGFGGD
jgi:hypothetical protein